MSFMPNVKVSTTKPFCHSVTVVESPVDEYETGSGIVVPTNYDGKTDIKRGMIIDVGPCPCEAWSALERGVVIYYGGGIKINDVIVVDHDNIIAFEEA